MIHTLSVQIRDLGASQLLQFLDRADTYHFRVILVHPDRQRCTPISVTRNTPITRILEPEVKSLLLHMIRYPVRLFVVLQKTLLDRRHSDVPVCMFECEYSMTDE